MTAPPRADLRTLAAEAILGAEPWVRYNPTDMLVDAVLAAVLPEHRRMVLTEAADAIELAEGRRCPECRGKPASLKWNRGFEREGRCGCGHRWTVRRRDWTDPVEVVRRLAATASQAGTEPAAPPAVRNAAGPTDLSAREGDVQTPRIALRRPRPHGRNPPMTQPDEHLQAHIAQLQAANDQALAALAQQGIQFVTDPTGAWITAVRLDTLIEHLYGNTDDPRRQRYELAAQQRFRQIIEGAQEQIEQTKAEAASQAARAKLLQGVNGAQLPAR